MSPPSLRIADLLQVPGLDPLSRTLLQSLVWIDVAADWNLYAVAAGTLLFLAAIWKSVGKRGGIEWYALLHAVVTGVGSVVCIYLDHSVIVNGVPQPLHAIRCGPPLTALHRMLPSITMGYSFLDLLQGVNINLAFALHGLATLLVMGAFLGHPQIITPMLVMEVSTIFLSLTDGTFWSPVQTVGVLVTFAVSFFLCRIVAAPYVWWELVRTMYHEKKGSSCLAPHIFPTTVVFGVFFHSLNVYWMYKIVRKARRKMKGLEGVQANNDIHESEKKKS